MSAGPVARIPATPAPGGRPAWRSILGRALGAALLVAAVWTVGSIDADVPWLPGDEYRLIVTDPDVTGAAPDAPGLATRLVRLATRVHDDLYQPLPMMSYALEWSLTGGDPASFRRTDVVLHAINALLLWWVLSLLIPRWAAGSCGSAPGCATGRTSGPTAGRRLGAGENLLAWSLALIWALHPALVPSFAGETCRVFVLGTLLALVALAAQIRSLRGGGWGWFAGSCVTLVGAMLCKPMPGWLILAATVDAAGRGWRRTLRSPRVYLVAAITLGFALLTLWTTGRGGLTQRLAESQVGDPPTRAGVAIWILARSALAPFWLESWYPPDPDTGWRYAPAWLGLGALAAGLAHAVWSWRRESTRGATIGWAWCWALLLPVIGLVPARQAAAIDRYLYQPLMGLLLVAGTLLAERLGRVAPLTRRRAIGLIGVGAGALAGTFIVWDRDLMRIARNPVRSAERTVRLHPGDPRALEMLALACAFAAENPQAGQRFGGLDDARQTFEHFTRRQREALEQAAQIADLERYYPNPRGRARYLRRLAGHLLSVGAARQALEQSQRATALDPTDPASWVTAARAHRALAQADRALEAYALAERYLAADDVARAQVLTEVGSLLMFELGRDAEACERYAAAMRTGRAPWSALLGEARCALRYGERGRGELLLARIVDDIATGRADDPPAARALAHRLLTDQEWEPAWGLYQALLERAPADLESLIGLHQAGVRLGRYADVVHAWRAADQARPPSPQATAFLLWARTLAGEDTQAAVHATLDADPSHRLACLSAALLALRAGRAEDAVRYVRRSAMGQPLLGPADFQLTLADVRQLAAAGLLPPQAVLIEGAILLVGGFPGEALRQAAAQIDALAGSDPGAAWSAAARQLQRELLVAAEAAP